MSFAGQKLLGVDFTQSGSTLEHTLGTRVGTDDGKEFVYIQANGAIAVGDIVTMAAGYDCPPLAAAGAAWAVANTAIADNSYGWVQVKGVVASAGVTTGPTTGARLMPVTGSGGLLDDAATPGAADGVFAIQLGTQSANKASIYIL
jgi:hypothetical protein